MAHRSKNIDDGPPYRALATTGFSDQAQGFALLEIEAHAIDRTHFRNLSSEHATGYRKPNRKILDFENLHWSPTRKHRAQCPGDISINSGSVIAQRSIFTGHRVTNL